jgi:hypothetical protein
MTDSPNQSDSQSDDRLVSDLNERLLRRATEPLGVIDVRYGQQKYFRIAGWLAARHSLFAHLMKRYQVAEASAYGEHPFAVPGALGQPGNLFSTIMQSVSPASRSEAAPSTAHSHAQLHKAEREARPSGLAEIIAERSSKTAPEPSVTQPSATPERTFRISRQPPPMLPKSAVATPSGKPAGGASLSSPASTDAILRRAGSVSAAEQASGEAPVSHETRATEARVNETRVNTTPIAPQTPPDFVFRKSDIEISEEKKTDVTPSASPQEKTASPQENLANAQGKSASSKERPAGSAASREPIGTPSTIAQPGEGAPAGASPTASLPLIKPLAAPPGPELLLSLQNQGTAHPSQSGDLAAQKSIRNSKASSLDPDAVMATEMRPDSFRLEMPDIIWRNPSDGLPSGGSPAASATAHESGASAMSDMGGANHNTSALTAQPSGQAGSPVQAQTERQEARVEQVTPQIIRAISEQVMRTITLDLKLERERRGGTKWR